MSSILNKLNSVEDAGLNLAMVVPLFAVLVVVIILLLKFSLRKPEAAKKTQNGVKKQQKLQISSNKQKEEKINNEKKDKASKEKKLSSSPSKYLDKQTANGAVKSNKKNSIAVDEKPSKKNSGQTKKHPQVNNNVNLKNNAPTKNNQISNMKQGPADDVINKAEEGEWQMVTTKKQKQTRQEEKIEIVTTPTKAGKKSQKSLEKGNKLQNSKTKKAKDMEKSDSNSKLVNLEVIATTEETKTVNSYPEEINKNENNFSPAPETIKFESDSDTTKHTLVNSNESIIPPDVTSVTNVAFDELGDDGWTDTKPQKKNRKRALRE